MRRRQQLPTTADNSRHVRGKQITIWRGVESRERRRERKEGLQPTSSARGMHNTSRARIRQKRARRSSPPKPYGRIRHRTPRHGRASQNREPGRVAGKRVIDPGEGLRTPAPARQKQQVGKDEEAGSRTPASPVPHDFGDCDSRIVERNENNDIQDRNQGKKRSPTKQKHL